MIPSCMHQRGSTATEKERKDQFVSVRISGNGGTDYFKTWLVLVHAGLTNYPPSINGPMKGDIGWQWFTQQMYSH